MQTTPESHGPSHPDMSPPALTHLVKGAAGGAVLVLALYGASVPLIEDLVPLAGSAALHTLAAVVGGLGGALLSRRA